VRKTTWAKSRIVSWPGLSRPSTMSILRGAKDVDARHEAGHDEASLQALTLLVRLTLVLVAKLVLERIPVLAELRSVVGIGHGEARRKGGVEEACAFQL
jgi:hypothetical protein